MEHWKKVGLAVAIASGFLTVLLFMVQWMRPTLPWHALVPATIIVVFLFIQLTFPWRHRAWVDEGLQDLRYTFQRVNAGLFFTLLTVAVVVLVAAYLAGRAPEWIEVRLEKCLQSREVSPLAAVGQLSAVPGADFPGLALAKPAFNLAPEGGSAESARQKLFLYPARVALSHAIGSTEKLSEYATLGIVAQAVIVLFLMLGERISEARAKILREEVGP